MVVIASRQPGLRPETIRTRLARFMPSRQPTQWTASWASHIERPDDDMDELRIADHLGCVGIAVSHALAQAEVAPKQLRVTAETTGDPVTGTTTMTLEVRATIDDLDQSLFEAIARRAEPQCPVWKGLASELDVKLIAILDEPGQAEDLPEAKPVAPVQPVVKKHRRVPTWLASKATLLLIAGLGVCAAVPLAWPLG